MPVVLVYTDTNVTNGETYLYSVAAINIVGQGTFTDTIEATPFRSISVPGMPRSVLGTAKGAKVQLIWNPPESDGGSVITGYVVLRGETANDLQVVANLGDVTSFIDEGLPRGRTYHYSVAAINDVGQGEPFDVFEVKVPKKKDEGPGFTATLVLGALAATSVLALRRRKG